jgi:hypothetical protein
MVVLNYMKFARYQRIQSLKAIDCAFKDVSESRYCVFLVLSCRVFIGKRIGGCKIEIMN